MKKILILMFVLTSLIFPFSYEYQGKTITVDDKKIERAFESGIDNMINEYGDSIDKEEIKIPIFNYFIGQEILLNSDFAKDVKVSSKEIEEQINLLKKDFSENEFYMGIQYFGYTKESFYKEVEEDIKFGKIREIIESQAKVTEDEIKSYYKSNKYSPYFANLSYEEAKNNIREFILENKRVEIVNYFIETERAKVILPKNSIYNKYYSKIVYEKEGFKYTNSDFVSYKTMFRTQGISDEDILSKMTKELIDKELRIVLEAKKLKINITEKLCRDDKISAYKKAYENRLIETTKITENELKDYFNENKESYFKPEIYDASIIELPVKISEKDKSIIKEKAQKVLNLALEGKDFSGLAKKYSEDGSAQDGGYLGWFSRGQMIEPFEEASFKGEIGKVIPYLVETEFGYHIIRVADKKSDGSEVLASHILFAFNSTEDTKIEIEDLAKNIIE